MRNKTLKSYLEILNEFKELLLLTQPNQRQLEIIASIVSGQAFNNSYITEKEPYLAKLIQYIRYHKDRQGGLELIQRKLSEDHLKIRASLWVIDILDNYLSMESVQFKGGAIEFKPKPENRSEQMQPCNYTANPRGENLELNHTSKPRINLNRA